MKRFALLSLILWAFAGCQVALELPDSNVCYDDHIKPLVKRDCAACHENGEWGVLLAGGDRDFPEIKRYVAPGEPDSSLFLWYAEGFNHHPYIWGKTSQEYRTFAAWISEGANWTCGVAKDDLFGGYDAPTDAPEGDVTQPEMVEDAPSVDLLADLEPSDTPTDVAPDIHDGVPDLPPDLPPDIPDVVPDLAPQPISFANDISPLHKTGCGSPGCHGGWTKPKIYGSPADYPTVMKYIDLSSEAAMEASAWEWASGQGKHKNISKWGKTGSSYLLFLQWVKEGAQNN